MTNEKLEMMKDLLKAYVLSLSHEEQVMLLNHIREMPLDIIKIDKCFIEHLGEDDFSDAFVKMVTELANTIGVHVCVEGVETDRQYAIIKKMGIYYIQGYFFDKPMCIESFEEKYI